MFQFRTNATSAHRHYINGIGEHDTYVEFCLINSVVLSVAWLARAIANAYAGVANLPKSLAKSRLRDIVRDAYATYGASMPPDESDAASAAFGALHATKHACNNARVWVTRQHAVRLLAYHLETLPADAAKPSTVESLDRILGDIAHTYGVNPPAADDLIVADGILFDVLPLWGSREFADDATTVETIAPPAIESTPVESTPVADINLADIPAITGETESASAAEPTIADIGIVETDAYGNVIDDAAVAMAESVAGHSPLLESDKPQSRRERRNAKRNAS